jgi:hypothetical protein
MDFDRPNVLNSTTDDIADLKQGRLDQARGFDPAVIESDPDNKPEGMIRWNSVLKKSQKLVSSVWGDLCDFYAISISGWAKSQGAGSSIASASTLDLSGRDGNIVPVTGSVSTNAVTMANGESVTCIAQGAWPLAYHATNMPVPGGKGYTCEVGDIVRFTKDVGSNLSIEISRKNGGEVTPNPTFLAYSSINRTFGGASPPGTKLTMDVESFDTDQCFDTSTSRFQPNVAGYYQINFSGSAVLSSGSPLDISISLVVNGSLIIATARLYGVGGDFGNYSFSRIVYMNGSTDYLELFGLGGGGGTVIVITGGAAGFQFSGSLVRRV